MKMSIDLPTEVLFDLCEFAESSKVIWQGFPERHSPETIVRLIVERNLRAETSPGFRKFTMSLPGREGHVTKMPALSQSHHESPENLYNRLIAVGRATEILIKKIAGPEAAQDYHKKLEERLADWRIILQVREHAPEIVESLNNRKEVLA